MIFYVIFLVRYSTLVFNIFLYVLLILASVILLVGLAVYSQWLLIPWIILMCVDIIRGIISVLFIFFLSHVSFNFLKIFSKIH